jgi:hypothetical protein
MRPMKMGDHEGMVRYVIVVTYANGETLQITIPGKSSWAHEYDPVPIVECITKALRRDEYAVEVREERTEVRSL